MNMLLILGYRTRCKGNLRWSDSKEKTLGLTSAGQKFLETTAKEDQTFLVLKSKLFICDPLDKLHATVKDWNHETVEDFSDLFNGLLSNVITSVKIFSSRMKTKCYQLIYKL